MKTLVVCKYHEAASACGFMAPFVYEQVQWLERLGVSMDVYLVKGEGAKGYLKEIKGLRRKIKSFCPDIIHAHYGLCCLLANLATRKVPVVSTYHGSDLNNRMVRPLSHCAMLLSKHNVFVSQKQYGLGVGRKSKRSVIPCGVDLSEVQQTPMAEARQQMQLCADKRYVLFAGSFANAVKDPKLAKTAIAELNLSRPQKDQVELIELAGYTRTQVNLLMCAVDCLLMTSKTEGSPQVIKEAMACGCPIVSVDVGDVGERISNLEGCCMVNTRQPHDIAKALREALSFRNRTNGREVIVKQGLDNKQVAVQIKEMYLNLGIETTFG